MLRKLAAFALVLVVAPSLAACTPVPSKGSGGTPAAAKPEDTCKRVRELADKDTDDAAILDQVERECVETLTSLQSSYATLTTCVEQAADANAIYECEKGLTKPRSLLAAAGPTAKLEQLCDHVMAMVEKELGEVASQMQPSELADLRANCIKDAGAQIEAKGVAAFNKEADCILAAQTIDALQACGTAG